MTPESKGELRTGGIVALAVLLAGLPAGVVWWLLAPLPRLVVRDGGVFLARETETAVAADGWFGVCGATVGLVAAVVVFARVRHARVGALLGLTLGGLAGSALAWRLGVLLGPAPIREAARGLAAGTEFDGPLKVSAKGVLLAWPLVSAVSYFALTAGLEPPGDRRGEHPADGTDTAGRRDSTDPRAGRRFPVTVLRPGYAVEEVDALLRRASVGEAGPDEVRRARFTPTRLRRGYDEVAVDAELALVADRLSPGDRVDGSPPASPPSP